MIDEEIACQLCAPMCEPKNQRINGSVNAHLINPWLSNEQIMMDQCLKCYIPNLMEIGTQVPKEKVFVGLLPYEPLREKA